ncbi:hypothetical protein HA402_006570 [Bradysia odoriphaga]|nr:hypothetical protein HA402_006570 [Bradysia odoriphaga]
MGSGEFWYGGLREKLTELCKKNNHGSKLVELNIHIDGTPVYKNSKAEFWPVQCDIKNIEMKPFFVEIYQGSSKPTSAELFLRPLLNEIHELSLDGLSVIINGKEKMFGMRIDKFILDAPSPIFSQVHYWTRGLLFMRKMNKAKNAGHVCLIGTNAPLRTDETFRSKENEEHHHSTSPLEELSIDMVRDIPLEYLHLILYGGMKRLLTLWVDGTRYFKFSKTAIEEISKKHEKVGLTKPTELNKPTRSLKCLSFWKATEFRTFLLKTGPIVLRDHLTEEIYNHFLTLHCAVTICCSKSLLMYLPVANQLFRSFTERFGDLYGDENKTYSIHSLIHVTDDVERFGVFDEYSAFPGENNLGFLKSLVRGGHLPLQQVVRRIAEREACEKICEFEDIANNIKEELNGGVLRLKGLRLDSSEKNGWILTKNKDILKILSINKREKIKIRGAVLLKQNQENLYEVPIASKSLCIYKSKLDSMPMSIDIEDIYCKLYRIEISSEKSEFVPLYHYTQ